MLKILYLEDNKFDVELTSIELKKEIHDCSLKVVGTVAGAIQLLNQDINFDIAILDLNLPDGNGIEVLMHIRLQELQIPVIIFTASGNEESAFAALKAGADDYLPKSHGYHTTLPETIFNVIKNFKKNIEKKSKPIRVLYVEWNKSDVELTQRHIQKYAPNIKLESVPLAFDALKLLPEKNTEICNYDVLLMDYRLQGINGLEAIKVIRQERELKIPIVVVTGQGSEEIAVQSLKFGADEYLVKSNFYLFRLPSALTNAYQKYELEQQQKALKESESKYRLLAENSGDVISIFDLNLNYTYVSPAVKLLRGFEVEEVLTQNLSEVLTPESFEQVRQLIAKFAPILSNKINETIPPQVIELEMIRKDKTTVWTEVKISIILDERKIPFAIQSVTRDISIRKKATEEIRKLSRAVEQSPVSVIITDTEGNIEYANPKFSEVSGYSFEEVKNKNPRILNSGKNAPEVFVDLWKNISSGNRWNGEIQNQKKDGTLFWEHISISPIADQSGKISHFVAVKEDVTEKIKYEKDLIIARDQAQESNRLKSAFLATMSHELRTPLNAIIGFSDIINESMPKESIIKFCKTINNSGNHLLSIIEDIFTVSLLQTKQSKVLIEEFDLSNFFKDLIQNAKIELNTKNKTNLKLLFNPEIYNSNIKLKTDKTKLFQVVINFIKNAIEYTDQGEIEIGKTIDNENITFYVRDTGIGIPTDKMEIIFEHFRQLDDSNTRMHDGVGLGLAICSEIQKLLKGKIKVESEVGKGTTFFFSLNNIILKKVKSESQKTTSDKINLQDKTILIVEDEITNYQFLKIYLGKTNANILWAKNGEESIEICKNTKNIDLVLMDIKMPGIDGFEATKQIKKLNRNLIVIAQTAYALADDREKAMNAGCDNYISKPIDVKNLMNLLKHYLQ